MPGDQYSLEFDCFMDAKLYLHRKWNVENKMGNHRIFL